MTIEILYNHEDFENKEILSTIFTLAQENAQKKPGEKIDLHYSDIDSIQILLLQKFFSRHSALLPPNLNLFLHDEADKDLLHIKIKGTGEKPFANYALIAKMVKDKQGDLKPSDYLQPSPPLPSSESDDEIVVDHEAIRQKNIALEKAVQTYKRKRDKQPYVKFIIFPFFQYTKKQKLESSDDFIKAIKGRGMISQATREVLLDGELSKTLRNAMDVATNEGLNDKLDELNEQNTIPCFVKLLEEYKNELLTQSAKAHFFQRLFIFGSPVRAMQVEKKVIENMINLLHGKKQTLSNQDLDTLSKGALGKKVNDYLKEYGRHLTNALQKSGLDINNNNPITSIQDFRSVLAPLADNSSPRDFF